MLSSVIPVVLRLVPGAMLLLVTGLALHSTALRAAVASLVPAYPLVVLVGGLLLGWRFDRSRLVVTLALLLLAERALATWAPTGGEIGRAIFVSLAVLVPLDLAALTWLPERGLLARPGRVALALLASQVVLIALLCQPLFLPLAGWLELPRAGLAGMPRLALAAFVAAAVVLARRALPQATALDSGAVWSLVAAFLAFSAGGGVAASLYLATGGLILVLSLIETWYGMAYVDELTGLPARRALNEALDRLRGTYAVAMVDLDHFKRFNDEHGHDVGDQLLRMVGARLADIGGGGRAFRYGGEEFAVLFQGKTVDHARHHLETLRRTIEATPFTLRAPTRPAVPPLSPPPAGARRRIAVTVSIGVAGNDGGAATPEEIVWAADEALYRAKQGGRNQVQT
jgi:diguanylate cyclase (GGDEF)-like protein